MAKKQDTFIDADLEWLEAKVEAIRKKIDANPIDTLRERTITLAGAMGPVEKVVATIEQQEKAHREALKDYAILMESVKKLREKEAAKIQSRGDAEISALAEDFLNNRK